MMEKRYWIELIGFDNTSPDYGADSFISRVSGDVAGVSLLFSNADFVLGFDASDSSPLTPCDCSYGAHPASEERSRQEWTKEQLKGLVSALHARGAEVVVSFFDMFSYMGDDGSLKLGKFCEAHPEVWCRDRNGNPCYIINMLKRLSDGTFLSDTVAKKLREVIEFYGFDGAQIADGISTFRQAVQNGDMSDDLVSQFVSRLGIVDSKLDANCDSSAAKYRRRRNYILDNYQNEWLEFCAERWGEVYDGFFREFDGTGKKLTFNSCWTRDPFEAYLRFGFDYKRSLRNKAYAVMVEEVSATAPIFGDEDRGGFPLSDAEKPDYHYEAYLMQQSIRAYTGAKQFTLTPIRDTCEQWDLMHHSPTEQERAIIRRNNNYVFENGKFVNCSSGPHYCLSDSMRKADWDYLFRKESASAPVQIEKPLGFLSVFAGDSIRKEAAYYLKTNRYSQTAIKNRLISAGLCIDGAIRPEDIESADNPLLIVNPSLWSENELSAADGKLRDAVVIGETNPFLQKADKAFTCGYLGVWLYGKAAKVSLTDKELFAPKKNFKPTNRLRMFGMWGMPLRYDELPKRFFKALAAGFNRAADLPEVISRNSRCVVTTFKLSEKRYRMLISNNAYHYYIAKVRFPLEPKTAKSLLKYDGYEVFTDGKCFYDRIPPRGMDILEIEIK